VYKTSSNKLRPKKYGIHLEVSGVINTIVKRCIIYHPGVATFPAGCMIPIAISSVTLMEVLPVVAMESVKIFPKKEPRGNSSGRMTVSRFS